MVQKMRKWRMRKKTKKKNNTIKRIIKKDHNLWSFFSGEINKIRCKYYFKELKKINIAKDSF